MTDQEIMEKVHNVGYEMLEWFDNLCKKYDIQYWITYGALLGAIRHKGFIPWDNDIDVWMTRDDYSKFMQHQDEFPDDYQVFLPTTYGVNRYYDLVTHIKYKYMSYEMPEGVYEFYNRTFPNGMHIDIFLLEKTYNDLRGKLQIIETTFLYGLMNSHRHKSIRINDYPLLWKICQSILNLIGKHISLNHMFKWAEKIAVRYNDCKDADYYYSSNGGLYVGKLFPVKAFQGLKPVSFGPLVIEAPEDSDQILKIIYGNYWELPSKEEQKLPTKGVVFTETENGKGI